MKQITEQQALSKLTALCSQSEHCSQDALEKMQKWGLTKEAQARNMAYLIQEKYIDDNRFALFFINDKIKYNQWGRRKIEQALYVKHISKDISDPIFEGIPDETYLEVLRPLLKNKHKNIHAKNEYELNLKLIKFALSRGFSMDLIKQCLDNIEEIPDNDF